MAKNERFVRVYSQGTFQQMQIWVDRVTGVNYLWTDVGGLTPLLNAEGKPIITTLYDENSGQIINQEEQNQ